MSDNYLLDTTILIDYLRGHQPTIVFVDKILSGSQGLVTISSITEFELYSGKSLDRPDQKQKVDLLLNRLIAYPVSSVILRKAGELRRHFQLSPGDAVIAATALQENCTVVTTDKDFSIILGLKVIVRSA